MWDVGTEPTMQLESSARASGSGGECIPVMLVSSEGSVNGSATSRGHRLGNRPRAWALARWGGGGPRSARCRWLAAEGGDSPAA